MDKLQKKLATQVEDLDKLASEQPFLFLQEADEVYKAYTRQMRRETRRLQAGVRGGVGIYQLWLDSYLPKINKIKENIAAGKLKRPLKSILLVDDDMSSDWMSDEILQLRRKQIRGEFRDEVQLEKRKSQKTLDVLLSRSDDEISKQAYTAIAFEKYKTIAKNHKYKVYDPHTGWLKRLALRYHVNRQKCAIYRSVSRQIDQLQLQTAEIEKFHDGLVGRLYGLDVDLIEILAARQEYEKALAKITPSPTKKIALYEKNTAKIRLPYLDKQTDLTSVKDLQSVVKELDDVLLTVFDLDVAEKNSLLTSVKKYRELVQQKQLLDKKLRRQRD